jgi:cell wall-associated NlpC family hydrolase
MTTPEVALRRRSLALAVSVGLALSGLVALPSEGAPRPSARLLEVQARVIDLQNQAASAAEGAQEAKVRLAQLNQTLAGVQEKAAKQRSELEEIRKSLGSIAMDQYKSSGLGQSLQLLFSADPQGYLASAGDLDSLTRRRSVELRRYEAATQKLRQTTMLVSDKAKLVRATQQKLEAQARAANAKLAEAEKILKSLKASERKALLAAQRRAEANDLASSRAAAKSLKNTSGRAGVAIRYAFAQIGDRYVFGAAGMQTWDCSGLTMRAFAAAGVSLPHSSRAQFRYGKKIPRSQLRPGDLVFFKRPISHVGIYIGNGKMVHAPRPGSRVKVAPINQMRYVGAVRL